MTAVGSGKISLALGGSKKPAPTNGVKRPRAALQDQEEDDESAEFSKAQRISHFDHSAGGAIDDQKPRQEERPLVIAPQANRDWKEAGLRNRRQKSGLLPVRDVRNGNREAEVDAVDESKVPDVGLTVLGRVGEEEEGEEEVDVEDKVGLVEDAAPLNAEQIPREKTEDERAMDALLGREQETSLVLPAVSEAAAFERDFRSAPEMATLDDYARVPVEQFGAALLRGMGWKDGEGIGSERGKKLVKAKMPERRAALLGIGAKEEAAVAQELGSWGRAAKDRKGPAVVYNPVLLRDKQTGELFTEEELQKRKEREEKEKYEKEFDDRERKKQDDRRKRDDSRDRYSDRREKERRHDRSRERESDTRAKERRRQRSYERDPERDVKDRRHRDDDSIRNRDRHRHRGEYDSDEEYRRRKREKERSYRERSDREYRSDRSPSRRNDSGRERDSDRKHRYRRT